MAEHSDEQQCRWRAMGDVELDAAQALADLASVAPGTAAVEQVEPAARRHAQEVVGRVDEREMASTRLSLELGKVGIVSCSSSGSSSSSQPQPQLQMPAGASSYGPRPRQMLTEAEKEAKRLRRVLANRESARQTILRRQAIRDELARKVAELSTQNENMKMEKETVMKEYLSLKETNKQLKEQVAKTAKKPTTPEAPPPTYLAEATPSAASPPPPSFLYTAGPPAMPVPYVWGPWPPCGPGYEHGDPAAGPAPPLCLPPCAWYYPLVQEPRGSPSGVQPFQEHGAAEPAGGGSPEEEAVEAEDDPCSLTLAIDVEKKGASESSSRAMGPQGAPSDREEKAATAAEARKRRKELTKLKQMHGGGRHGGAPW